jgi:hypothetical protein
MVSDMNKEQYLLICLMEEAAEIQQACAKALRFGITNVHPVHRSNNLDSIKRELNDLEAIRQMLVEAGVLGIFEALEDCEQIDAKMKKVEKYMKESKEIGTLN